MPIGFGRIDVETIDEDAVWPVRLNGDADATIILAMTWRWDVARRSMPIPPGITNNALYVLDNHAALYLVAAAPPTLRPVTSDLFVKGRKEHAKTCGPTADRKEIAAV